MPGFSLRAVLLLLATLLTGAGLLACGGGAETTSDVVTDTTQGPIPSPPDARQALNESLQAYNDYCLTPSAQSDADTYPLDLFNPSPNAPSFKYQQLWALTQVGLLDTTIVRDSRGLPVHQFQLTSAGRSAQYDIAQGRTYKPMFCYAVPHVVRLDSIKAVYSSGPNALSKVWFAYSYRNLGDWRRSAYIRRAYSALPPLPSAADTLRTDQLLIEVDSAWIDRRLSGYERPPSRPNP
jgi:hypothetical protein